MTEQNKGFAELAEYLQKTIDKLNAIIGKPEFTEEGLYEMANGEKINVKFYLNENHSRFIQDNEMIHMHYRWLWNVNGKRIIELDKPHPTDLIRYLGKKPFEIDKPGVYENGKGEKIILSEKNINCNPINGLKISDHTIRLYYRDGTCCSTNDNSPIVKFISSTWNFEKGEPV